MTKAPPPTNPPEPPTPLDQYLDGQLDGEQRDAFEQQLETDADLQAEVELQRQIDARLGQAWAKQHGGVGLSADALRDKLLQASTSAPASDTEHADPPAPIRPAIWHSPVLRVAAVLGLVALIGGGLLLKDQASGPTYADLQYVNIAQVYQQELTGEGQTGGAFEPDWVCDNQRFADTIQEKLNRQLALAAMPSNRAMLGLSYVPRARESSVVMLGTHDDQPILVFFDRPNLVDQFYTLEPGPGLHIHEREIGGLRVIELSPLAEPTFLDYIQAS